MIPPIIHRYSPISGSGSTGVPSIVAQCISAGFGQLEQNEENHRRNPRDFYPLHFFHDERSVADRNPVGSDDGGEQGGSEAYMFQ